MIHKKIPYRIQQRERKINHRLYIVKNIWNDDISTFTFPWNQPGFYDKRHLGCSCWMCRCNTLKYSGHKVSEKRKLLRERDGEEYE